MVFGRRPRGLEGADRRREDRRLAAARLLDRQARGDLDQVAEPAVVEPHRLDPRRRSRRVEEGPQADEGAGRRVAEQPVDERGDLLLGNDRQRARLERARVTACGPWGRVVPVGHGLASCRGG
jgi:hypothetical protein